MSGFEMNRRQFLQGAGALAVGALLPERGTAAPVASSLPVSIARCETYALPTVLQRLDTMLDQIGGIQKLVSGKTVAVKVNMVNTPSQGFMGLPSNRTYQIHPNVARALAILLDRAGASRIRFLESTFSRAPVEQFFIDGGWDLRGFDGLHAKVEFEDTRNLGKGSQYHGLKVPGGGSLFPAYDVNHSYADCDVYVSLAKLKNHLAAGVTLSMKNNFGITPTSLYSGPNASEDNVDARDPFHDGNIKPAAGVPQEVDPSSPRRMTYRVPRHIVDAVGIRPIHLAIIDGIETVSGGEGPWHKSLAFCRPHLLFAGRNPVCTDSVAVAAMGYDPMAKPGTQTFPGDNHLALAAALGLGTNDPSKIEVVGLPLKEAIHAFNWQPSERNY
jgi:uncharacterized protein (DUF362 family)